MESPMNRRCMMPIVLLDILSLGVAVLGCMKYTQCS